MSNTFIYVAVITGLVLAAFALFLVHIRTAGIGGVAGGLEDPEPLIVSLGASAPSTVRNSESFTARFVAYAEGLEPEVKALLESMSPRSKSHLRAKRCRWRIGTKVQVKLYGDDLNVHPPIEEFSWEGSYNIIDFDVITSRKTRETTVLKFDVSIDEIVVARLRVDITIGAALHSVRRTVLAEPASTAFASYASEDRLRVLDRLAEIRRNGMDVFLDCLSLHPGEEWKPALEAEILQRELFLLFWSAHAKRSEWVAWEWRTALRHKGLPGIEPHPLDPVFEAEPPEELKALHFGDPYMLVRKAYESHS